MTVDTATGAVTNVVMTQSTGNAMLDNSATSTFRRWRFRAGTVARVRQRITFSLMTGSDETISPQLTEIAPDSRNGVRFLVAI